LASFDIVFNTQLNSKICCSAGPMSEVVGRKESLVSVTVGLSAAKSESELATISLTGPAEVWFGVGFGATLMAAQPYAITVEGGTGEVTVGGLLIDSIDSLDQSVW
jgi:hypothetical protein